MSLSINLDYFTSTLISIFIGKDRGKEIQTNKCKQLVTDKL